MEYAVITLGIVACLAMTVSGIAVFALARSARERRGDFMRAAIIERQAELAGSAAELGAIASMSLDIQEQRESKPAGKHKAVQREREKKIRESHLNPNDPDDVRLFDAMRERGLDPTHPEDVYYWNMVMEAGVE